jgi:GIY-YIG catalytic domain-containing protein
MQKFSTWKSKMSHSQHMEYRRGQSRSWCYVYALREEGSDEFRYVGQTQVNPRRRMRWHWKNLGHGTSPLQRWLMQCKQEQRRVVMDLIDLDGQWNISEAVWIDRLTRGGHNLLNVLSRVQQ